MLTVVLGGRGGGGGARRIQSTLVLYIAEEEIDYEEKIRLETKILLTIELNIVSFDYFESKFPIDRVSTRLAAVFTIQ